MMLDATMDKIATNLRHLMIIEVLSRHSEPVTATEINATLNLPKPTIHRLVATLEEEGFLIRHIDGRGYVPGLRLRRMMQGIMRAGQNGLPQRQILMRLNSRIQETCNLSIPDGDAMVYIDRVETHWPLRIQLQVGSKVPLHATSAGKIYLANMRSDIFDRYLKAAKLEAYTSKTIIDPDILREDLDRIRDLQYATDDEEFVEGMIAVAVPVKNGAGEIQATISFHAPCQRMTVQDGLAHLDALREAAEDLAAVM